MIYPFVIHPSYPPDCKRGRGPEDSLGGPVSDTKVGGRKTKDLIPTVGSQVVSKVKPVSKYSHSPKTSLSVTLTVF